MKELSFDQMEKVNGGGWKNWECGFAFGMYGLAIAGLAVATGGVGLVIAGASFAGSAVGVVASCT